MPLYEYRVTEGHAGCEACRKSLAVTQRMVDESLKACPKCGAPIQRLLSVPAISTPAGVSHYKNLGFTRLEKRDTGVYENVTATGNESRYMEAGKPETLPDLKSKIED